MKHAEVHNPFQTRKILFCLYTFSSQLHGFQCCPSLNIFPVVISRAATVARNGTCYSSTECKDKSGEAAGGCAAG